MVTWLALQLAQHCDTAVQLQPRDLTHAFSMVGLLWQQETRQDFLPRALIDVRLELQQRLGLVLRQPECFEVAGPQREGKELKPEA